MPSLTITDLFINPTGKGSANFFSRSMIKELMTDILKNKVVIRPQATSGIYKDQLVLHIKVSSTKYQSIFFDVVIAINIQENLAIEERSIQVFSNSPNFQFTYAYVINDMGGLFEPLKGKCLLSVLDTPPSTRNSSETLGFEKSTLLALLFLRRNRLLSMDVLMRSVGKKKLNLTELHENVHGSSQILEVYEKFTKQERAANQRSRKLKQEQQAREQQAAIAGFTVKSKSRPTVKKSNVRGMAKTTSTAKNVRNVKSVKTK